MLMIWQRSKGYIMGATAFIACPCHLPITLPLILALTGGTAVGGWLASNTTLIYAAATLYFAGGLLLAMKWLSTRQPRAPKRAQGPAEVVLVVSSTCTSCEEADKLWSGLRGGSRFRYRKADINSGKGRSLAAKHKIFTTPTTLINGDVAFRGVPNRLRARVAVGR